MGQDQSKSGSRNDKKKSQGQPAKNTDKAGTSVDLAKGQTKEAEFLNEDNLKKVVPMSLHTVDPSLEPGRMSAVGSCESENNVTCAQPPDLIDQAISSSETETIDPVKNTDDPAPLNTGGISSKLEHSLETIEKVKTMMPTESQNMSRYSPTSFQKLTKFTAGEIENQAITLSMESSNTNVFSETVRETGTAMLDLSKVNVKSTENENKDNIFSITKKQSTIIQKSTSIQTSRKKSVVMRRERNQKQKVKESNLPQKYWQLDQDCFRRIKRVMKVDFEVIEENVEAVREAYDTETAEYARELYQANTSVTEAVTDNRIKFIENEESDSESKPAPKYNIYSNIIFFPDKSKGAAPKRYGPKRLGSVYNEETHDSADFNAKEFSYSGVFKKSPRKYVLPYKARDFKDFDSEITEDQSTHSVKNTEEVECESLAKYQVHSGKDSLLDGSYDECTSETPQTTNTCKDSSVKSDPIKDVMSVNDLSPSASDHWQMDLKHLHTVEPSELKPEKDTVSRQSIAMPECKEGILKSSESNKGENPSTEPSSDNGSKKRVNICQSPFHLSDKPLVKSVVNRLQHSMPTDVDFSKLKSRQARYASQLRSSRTNPGGDNRMILEFDLPTVTGAPDTNEVHRAELRDRTHANHLYHHRNSSGSESDNHLNCNDFGDDGDSSDDNESCNNSFSSESSIESGVNDAAHRASPTDVGILAHSGEMLTADRSQSVSCYSEDLARKYGVMLKELKRVKTNLDNDNRVIIHEGKASLAAFEDDNQPGIKSDGLQKEDSQSPKHNFTIRNATSVQGQNKTINNGEELKDKNPTQDNTNTSNQSENEPFVLPHISFRRTRLSFLESYRESFGGLPDLDMHMNMLLRSLQDRYQADSDEEQELSSIEDKNDDSDKRLSLLNSIRGKTKLVRSKESSEEIQQTLLQQQCRSRHRAKRDSPRSQIVDQNQSEPVIKLVEDSDGSTLSSEEEENDLLLEVSRDVQDSDQESTFVLPDADAEDVWSNIFMTEIKRVMLEKDMPSNSRVTVLCLDISSSMVGAPWLEMRASLQTFIIALEKIQQDENVEEHLAVVVFGHETRIALAPTKEHGQVLELFDGLKPGGCSPLASGLVLCSFFMLWKAFGQCSLTLNGIPVPIRIILFTDGFPTPVEILQGPDKLPEDLQEKAVENILATMEELKGRNELPIFCVAISDDPNMEFLERLSTESRGKVVRPADVAELAKDTFNYYIAAHVGGQMLEAAEDNKISMKVFQKLVWTVYPSVSHQQAAHIKEIMLRELKRRDDSSWMDSSDEEGENLVPDISVEKTELLPLGTRVVKGPDFSDPDDGISEKLNRGIVISHNCKQEGTMLIHWNNGMILPFKCGHENKCEVMPDENPPPPNYNPANPVQVGAMVRRGPDWQYGNQDGGSDQLGTVLGIRQNGELLVKWPKGTVCNYRHSREKIYDVLISDPKDPFGRNCYISEMNRRNKEDAEQKP